ncbi:MAG: sigma-54-dependent Fis family transcriptional regulator [Deltaproteobacteria bacterium]|nr:sigma-54-dependent Fis family transcriptional regulator [Deltaproteobacteria bacterium]
MAKILIIDDDPDICEMLVELIRRMGHEALSHESFSTGMAAACGMAFDVVLLDVRLPDGNGLGMIGSIRQTASSPEVIILTGYGDPDGAETAIKSGAWDYIQKTDTTKKITLSLQRVIQYRQGIKQTIKSAVALKLDGIVGVSHPMQQCFDMLAQAAVAPVNVLLTGETGTGKEVFARAIHQNSPRSAEDFVTVDCAALPENLIESLLFGHRKGAYTGATQDQTGLVAQAHNGTLFLDEVGEMPLPVQKAFLRVLQERKYRRIGGRREHASDFRLIAATHRNLDALVENGAFRKDLLYRLRGIDITLPALRDRCKDIIPLCLHYNSGICEKRGLNTKGFSPDFFEVLSQYHWPGNIRELISTLEIAISAAHYEPTLFSRHIPESIRIQTARAAIGRKQPEGDATSEHDLPSSETRLPPIKAYRKEALDKADRQYLSELAQVSRGEVEKACRISGLSRSRLYELLKLMQIPFKT